MIWSRDKVRRALQDHRSGNNAKEKEARQRTKWADNILFRVPSGCGRSWLTKTSYPLCLLETSDYLPSSALTFIHTSSMARCFRLFLLPWICPVSFRFSKPSFLVLPPPPRHKFQLSLSDSKQKLCFLFPFAHKTSRVLICFAHGYSQHRTVEQQHQTETWALFPRPPVMDSVCDTF